MKLLISLICIFISFSASAENFYNLTFKDLYNQDVKLSDYNVAGRKGFVVNAWATWCPPCVKELPTLLNLQYKMPNITVVAIATDMQIAKIKRFLKQNNYNQHSIVFLQDKKGVEMQKLGLVSLPTTFIVNSNGQIMNAVQGADNWVSNINLAQIKYKLNIQQ